MAKVPLKEKDSGGTRYEVGIFLRKRSYRISKNISVIFDTGCPETLILSQGTMKKLDVSYNNLKEDKIINLGGLKHKEYHLGEITGYFRDINGKTVKTDIPEVKCLKCTKESKKEQAYRLPNLLGMKFLKEKDLDFSTKGTPTLEGDF